MDIQEAAHVLCDFVSSCGNRVFLKERHFSDFCHLLYSVSGAETKDSRIAELESEVRQLKRNIAQACQLSDTGSLLHKATFDLYGIEEIPTGWRVVEKMRETLLAVSGQEVMREP